MDFFRRPPMVRQLPGHLVILGGLALLIVQLEDGLTNPAVLLMLISEVAVVASSLTAEKHPDNNDTNPRARRRFTGVVLLLTAGLFLVLRLGQGLVWGIIAANPAGTLHLLSSSSLWISGILVGVLLRGPVMYTSLQAIRLVGTEIYLLCIATLPFFGWLFEIIAMHLGLLDAAPIPSFDLWLDCLIVSGSVYIILTRWWQTPSTTLQSGT